MQKMRRLLQTVQYELVIFAVLMFELCRFAPQVSQMNAWITTPYTLSYRFGFGSRFLIGSIIRLFTDYLSVTLLWCLLFSVCTLLILMVSAVCGRMIRRSDPERRPFTIAVILLFLASPASVSYLFSANMFGRLETYHIILTIAALCIMRHKVLKWLIPLLCALMIAIHQFYVFTYAPLLFIVLFYEMVHARYTKQSVALFVLSALALCVSFFVFQFLTGNLNAASPAVMMREIASYSNAPVLETMLHLEYFAPLHEATTATSIPAHPRLLVYSAGTLLLLSPLIVLLYAFWLQCAKAATDKMKKALFLLMLFFPLIFTPAFYLTVDWGRYLAPIFISHFALILYLLYHKEPAVVQAAEQMTQRYTQHRMRILTLALYLTALGKFNANAALNIVARVFEAIEMAVHKLF